MAKSEANWLVYMHIYRKEEGHERKTVKKMQSNLQPGVAVYLLHFGPNTNSDAILTKYTNNDAREVLRFPNKSIPDVVKTLEKVSKHLIASKVKVDAVCFACHGASYGMGKWKTYRYPFLQINDAVRYLVDPFGPSLVCFDSCFQGNMSCLYELPQNTKVVLASPAFHPFVSLLWTRAFGRLKRQMGKSELLRYGHSITCEWNDLTKATWKCMLLFDMKYIPIIAKVVKENFDLLLFDRISQIDKEDANLHDLFAAARNLPDLQMMIIKSIASTCERCLTSCTKRVRGMSTEAHLPRKWLTAYSSTKWYKEIVKDQRGFRAEKLQEMLNDGKV